MPMPKGHTQRNALGRIIGSRGLTNQQTAFVRAFAQNGGDAEAAAAEAGYAVPRVRAHELMRHPLVRQAVTEELRGGFARVGAMTLKLLASIDGNVMPPPRPPETGAVDALDDASIDELEAELELLKARRAATALVVGAD